MKKISGFVSAVFFFSIFFAGLTNALQASDKTVYYFWAENCSVCKEAQSFYKKPEDIKDGAPWTHNGLRFISYKIVDGNNKIISKNMNQLLTKCEAIAKKTGSGNFVYYRRDIYEFYKNKNLPYFRKEEKYSRKDEPFPTPVFIIGNRVILGFNQDLINKAVDSVR